MPQISQTMGTTVPVNGLNTSQENFDTPTMQGTMQQVLSDNLGRYVVVDFLVGVDTIARRVGILESVGRSFLVLYEEISDSYQVCDIFSVKFVSFFPPGFRPNWHTDPNLNISVILRPGGSYSGLLSGGGMGQQANVPPAGIQRAGSGVSQTWRRDTGRIETGTGSTSMYEGSMTGSMTGSTGVETRSPETQGGCSHGY